MSTTTTTTVPSLQTVEKSPSRPDSDSPSQFKHIIVKPLHPTFGAEISGIDFSQPVPDEVFTEVLAAVTKVSPSPY